MIIKHPEKENIPGLRSLWRATFGDTDAFLDSFFTSAFAENRCLCALEDSRILAAVYWFDCSWEDRPVAYIYALAADSDLRGQGIGKQLMENAHRVLKEQGYLGVCLVPGEEWLKGYYEKLGYRSFGFARNDCIEAEGSAWITEIEAEDYRQERNRILKGAVLHSKQTFDFLERFCGFYAGENFLLCGALEENTLYIQEFLGACRNLPGILTYLGAEKAVYKQLQAMYLPLNEETALPSYFGISMN